MKRARAGISALSLGAAATLAAASLTSFVLLGAARAASAAPSLPATASTTLPAGDVNDVQVDDVHGRVFVAVQQIGVIVTDLDGAVTDTLIAAKGATDLILSPDSTTLYAVLHTGPGDPLIASGSMVAIDTASLAVTGVNLGDRCPIQAALANGKIWFSYYTCSAGSNLSMAALDPADGTVSGDAPTQWGVMRGAADLPRLVILWNGQIKSYDLSSGTPSQDAAVSLTSSSPCPDGAIVPGGAYVIPACGSAEQILEFTTLQSVGVFSGASRPESVAVSPDGKFLALGESTSAASDVLVYDIHSGIPGVLIGAYKVAADFNLDPNSLAWSTTGRLYAVDGTSGGSPVLRILPGANKLKTTMAVKTTKRTSLGKPAHVTGNLSFAPGVASSATVTRTTRTGSVSLASVPVASDGSFAFDDTPTVSGPCTYTVAWTGDVTHGPASASAMTRVQPLAFDFNGDGYADVAVGSPLEDVGSIKNAGSVTIMYNTAGRLTGTGSQYFDQNSVGVPSTAETGDQFGWSNASGDFNGDGYADLAISSNAEDVDVGEDGNQVNAGTITILHGSATGITTTGSMLINGYLPNGFLGEAMAVGDFNGDGYADLSSSQDQGVDTYSGGPSGLSSYWTAVLQPGSKGVPGKNLNGELWGFTLSAGDINADGDDDIAIGAPWDYIDHQYSAGSATVAYGSASGLTGTGSQRFTKDTAGVPGSEHTFVSGKDAPDDFGWQVDLADFNGDGKADLAVGAPGSPVWDSKNVKHEDAGTVTILYSTGSKIGTTNSVQVSQETAGMPGLSAKGDFEGQTMAVGDANGDGKADLTMFSPGDHYVTMVMGASSGLQFGHAAAWTQNSTGIPGADEAGDAWGDSLRFENFKGVGPQGLAVGAPGENSGAGALTIIYSTTAGLTGSGSQYFDQNSPGIAGTAEAGDWFGSYFSN